MSKKLKYNFQKEFQHFLHEENIYLIFLDEMKTSSNWKGASMPFYFDYVDARLYIKNTFNYSHLYNGGVHNHELYVEKTRYWNYYYILWIFKLLYFDSINILDKFKLLLDAYGIIMLYNGVNDTVDKYLNPYFINKIDKSFKDFIQENSINIRDNEALIKTNDMIRFLKDRYTILQKRENG